MRVQLGGDPNDLTLRAYELAADAYAHKTPTEPDSSTVAFIDGFLSLLGPSPRVLEIGSGTGRDAELLEHRGASVVRTDAANSFVARLHAAGHQVHLLNVLTDDLGGPYDGVFANAVFLHLRREDLPGVLSRIHDALRDKGALAFTVKVGQGDAWSQDKLRLPRFFAYWSADDIREVVDASLWELVGIAEVVGMATNWLHVLCRRA